ncbi:biotin/lipoyl-binding protein, partial [uncultured Ruminococcus sp.]|uniref:serine hydrolase n=1 Tax=uncultured Ruminococcus sp. TaxID=165186 RepID=UPI0025D5F446
MAVKKKAIIIPLVALLVVGGGAYGLISMAKSTQESMLANMRYTVVPAGQNDLSETISTTGSVIGNGTVDVTTKLNATISEVKVSLGDVVKEGDLLCVFDTTELQEDYNDLKKQLENSDKKTQSGHDKNARDLESAKTKKQTALDRAQRAIDKAIKERDDGYEKYNKLVGEYNAAIDAGDEFYNYDAVNATLEQLKPGLTALDDAVTTAQEAYNGLSDEQKALVSNYAVLITSAVYPTPCAHKYGWDEASYHDMAIVYDEHPYVLAIMTDLDQGGNTDDVLLGAFIHAVELIDKGLNLGYDLPDDGHQELAEGNRQL